MVDDDPWIGTMLDGRYRIAQLIGRGGMAAVYRARDIQLDRSVAVKIFAPGTATDDARRRAEVQLLARLSHPNLVTLFDAHLAPEGSTTPSYLSMELVDGPDLRVMMDRGALPGGVTAQLTSDIAEALMCVHASGVVHRDLKPANVLLESTGLPSPRYRAKLADFGIAHLVGGERLTTTGLIVGTAAYLSPEQASGLEPGASADIYALGLVVLECLSGARAFSGTIAEVVSARLVQGPEIPATVPPAWASLIRGMTENDPAARPSAVQVALTARQIAADLHEWSPPPVAGSPRGGTIGSTGPAGSAEEATEPMPEPTRVMPEPTRVMPEAPAVAAVAAAGMTEPTERLPEASRSEVSPAHADRARITRAAVVAGLVAVIILAAVFVTALLMQSHGAPLPTPTPTHTSTAVVTHTPPVSSPPTPTRPGPGTSDDGHDKGKGKEKGHKGK
ncbi:MAG TPA: serine/threonine-protein kinase [Humibacter sp.]|nr:serine/threonine-protein kinase [Humibacter sp.]